MNGRWIDIQSKGPPSQKFHLFGSQLIRGCNVQYGKCTSIKDCVPLGHIKGAEYRPMLLVPT